MRAVRGALLTGILLGIETGIPRSLLDDFEQTSTTHIIAIPGFNIAILGGAIALLTKRFLGIYRSALVSVAAIVLYTVLVGADAAAQAHAMTTEPQGDCFAPEALFSPSGPHPE